MGGIGTALAVAAIGSSIYGTVEQKKQAKKAQSLQEQQAMEARRIAASQKPMEEAATMDLNPTANADVLGTLGLTVAPDMAKRTTTGLNTGSSPTGLGFSV